MKYFIVYWWKDTRTDSYAILNAVSDKSPMDWLKDILSNKPPYENYALIYWIEISDYEAEKITDLVS